MQSRLLLTGCRFLSEVPFDETDIRPKIGPIHDGQKVTKGVGARYLMLLDPESVPFEIRTLKNTLSYIAYMHIR